LEEAFFLSSRNILQEVVSIKINRMGCTASKEVPPARPVVAENKNVAEAIKQENAAPRAEPMKTTSRGFQKSKGGSTLFSENANFSGPT
jgi:hypothetical protein